MRLIALIVFMFITAPLMAQRFTGLVMDRITRKPVAFANVKTGYQTYYTNVAGEFNLDRGTVKDTAMITFVGYKPYHLVLPARTVTDTIKIYLDQVSIMLKSVGVGGRRDFKKDSLANRRLFSSVYNYKSPGIKDALVQKASLAYTPGNQINALNSTASLAGFDLLSVIGLFKKGSNNISRLKKAMVKDEESNYVDRTFSKQRVGAVTALKGDSLQNFILKYRPSISELKSMSDYELMMYIKKCYKEYKQ